jgi:hypothetical protein
MIVKIADFNIIYLTNELIGSIKNSY